MLQKWVLQNLQQPLIVKTSRLSGDEIDAEIEKGYQDMLAGRTVSAKKVFADIRKDYGLEGHHAKEKR